MIPATGSVSWGTRYEPWSWGSSRLCDPQSQPMSARIKGKALFFPTPGWVASPSYPHPCPFSLRLGCSPCQAASLPRNCARAVPGFPSGSLPSPLPSYPRQGKYSRRRTQGSPPTRSFLSFSLSVVVALAKAPPPPPGLIQNHSWHQQAALASRRARRGVDWERALSHSHT